MLNKKIIYLILLSVSINLYSLPTFYKYYDSGQKTFDVSPPQLPEATLFHWILRKGNPVFYVRKSCGAGLRDGPGLAGNKSRRLYRT
jgi:hypothetical protein